MRGERGGLLLRRSRAESILKSSNLVVFKQLDCIDVPPLRRKSPPPQNYTRCVYTEHSLWYNDGADRFQFSSVCTCLTGCVRGPSPGGPGDPEPLRSKCSGRLFLRDNGAQRSNSAQHRLCGTGCRARQQNQASGLFFFQIKK